MYTRDMQHVYKRYNMYTRGITCIQARTQHVYKRYIQHTYKRYNMYTRDTT